MPSTSPTKRNSIQHLPSSIRPSKSFYKYNQLKPLQQQTTSKRARHCKSRGMTLPLIGKQKQAHEPLSHTFKAHEFAEIQQSSRNNHTPKVQNSTRQVIINSSNNAFMPNDNKKSRSLHYCPKQLTYGGNCVKHKHNMKSKKLRLRRNIEQNELDTKEGIEAQLSLRI